MWIFYYFSLIFHLLPFYLCQRHMLKVRRWKLPVRFSKVAVHINSVLSSLKHLKETWILKIWAFRKAGPSDTAKLMTSEDSGTAVFSYCECTPLRMPLIGRDQLPCTTWYEENINSYTQHGKPKKFNLPAFSCLFFPVKTTRCPVQLITIAGNHITVHIWCSRKGEDIRDKAMP